MPQSHAHRSTVKRSLSSELPFKRTGHGMPLGAACGAAPKEPRRCMKPETERLFYERITLHHAEALQDELCDPRVYEHIDDGKVPTPGELRASFVRREAGAPSHRSSETWLDFAVRLKSTGEGIGRVEATVLGRQAELAYLFGYRHWGHAYAREAVQWLERLIAEEHAVDDLWATVHPGNRRSMALLNRLGYAEAPRSRWPTRLTSHDEGDRVFHRPCERPDGVA